MPNPKITVRGMVEPRIESNLAKRLRIKMDRWIWQYEKKYSAGPQGQVDDGGGVGPIDWCERAWFF